MSLGQELSPDLSQAVEVLRARAEQQARMDGQFGQTDWGRPRLGCDICPVERIRELYARHAEAFVQRLLSPEELLEWECLGQAERRIWRLAALYAGKEALSKALGLGLYQPAPGRDRGLSFKDLCILHDAAGAPYVQLGSEAALRLESLGLRHCAISLSHDGGLALALVLLS